MKSRIFVLMSTIAVFAVLGIRIRVAAQDQQEQKATQPHRYTVINLGTLGGIEAAGYGINNRGWVNGDADLQGSQTEHGFLWRNGVKVDLGTFGGPNSSAPGFPNDKGVIVGTAQTPEEDPNGEFFNGYGCPTTTNGYCLGVNNINLPFRWEDNTGMTPLLTLGGNQGSAVAVNNGGQVVGIAENSTQDTSCVPPQVLDFEAAIWEPNRLDPQELPPFPGDTTGQALAINDHGDAVGCSGTCGSTSLPFAVSPYACVHATLWRNSEEGWSVTDLGNLGGTPILAAGINNRGQVAGGSFLAGDATFHAFLWTEENGMQDLGTLPGDFSTGASGMNNKGQIVGGSMDATGNSRAFLWENGVMTDLNTLISSGSSLYLTNGVDINDNGEIVGGAFDPSTGASPSFLAIPCDDAHADDEGCQDTSQASVRVERPKVVLPENVREQLQRRMLFGRFGRQLGGAR